MTKESDPRPRLSLAGEWQLAFDPAEEGIGRGWPGAGPKGGRGSWPAERANPVRVPAIWDVTYPDAEGVGFYRRTFRVPADWSENVVLLHCDGAAYRAEVWVNGQFAGSHEGAYTPFELDVTRLLRAGAENDIVVRVASLSRTRTVDGMLLKHVPAAKLSWHYIYGGLWGEVYLEARPWLAVDGAHVEPDLQRETALVEVTLHNRRAENRMVMVTCRIFRPDGALAAEPGGQVPVPPGVVRLTYRVPLPRPWPWHPDNPQLYRLDVVVDDGGGQIDQLAVTFGMRDFTVQEGQFILNGRPIFLRGILLQPNWPISLVTPHDREIMVREISLARAAGFNLIRLHIQPAPPGFLDLADEMGLLIYAETSLAWIRDSPRMLDHARREIKEMVERDYNHPSVVFWGILNENPPASILMGEALVRHTRALDATRVVVENSGGSLAIDQDFGWIDRAHVVANRETARQKILDVHLYLGNLVPGPIYDWVRGLGAAGSSAAVAEEDFGAPTLLAEFDREQRAYRGQVFVSELGGAGMSDLDETVAAFGEHTNGRDARQMRAFRDDLHAGFASRRLDRVFGSVHGLVQASQALQAAGIACQLEALLCNPRVSGYVMTQLNDVSSEFHAGLLDLWRNPKPAYYASQRLNRPQVIILRAAAPVVAAGEPLSAALTLVNCAPLAPGMRVIVSVRDPAGQDTEILQQPAPVLEGIHELGPITVMTGAPGSYQLSARLQQAGEVVAETEQAIVALATLDWSELPQGITWLGQRPAFLEQAGLSGLESEIRDDRLLVAASPGSLFDEDWRRLLEAVEAGGTAIIGPLHKRDELALRSLAQHGINLELSLGIGSWIGSYHWIPDSDLFAGLPAGGLAGAAYVDVLPWYGLPEQGGEVLAGSLRNSETRIDVPRMLWYSDIEAVPLGAGEITFCQYRPFENAHVQPLAARLTANLLRLAATRRAK
jgi:beta-galactosidase